MDDLFGALQIDPSELDIGRRRSSVGSGSDPGQDDNDDAVDDFYNDSKQSVMTMDDFMKDPASGEEEGDEDDDEDDEEGEVECDEECEDDKDFQDDLGGLMGSEDEEEEDEEFDEETMRKFRKLWRYAKYKQDKLITTYMRSILKLKYVRKRNLYYQDRIYKHLREKETFLKECYEAVRERVESLEKHEAQAQLEKPEAQQQDRQDVLESKMSRRTEIEEEEPPEVQEEDLVLPEFQYELSDVSLTKMKYGSILRKDVDKILKHAKVHIKLAWPLTVKGFADCFKKQNPYGKVIYTMRLPSQIKHTKKISRKYKYVLHNYNYQMQQYDVMTRVHAKNMEHLENSRMKWESLVGELFVRVLEEIREYSAAAIDKYGKRLSREEIERSCRDIVKQFQSFQHSWRIFYRVLFNVMIAIRHLCYSESHGEGVELYEFQHLLRSNETIGEQHNHRRNVLKNYRKKCKRFVSSYNTQLDAKKHIEKSVTEKFRTSGQLSCDLVPRQENVKLYERMVKKLLKEQEILYEGAGIVPFKLLVLDYVNTSVAIAAKRQERIGIQVNFSRRVREVRQYSENLKEIKEKKKII